MGAHENISRVKPNENHQGTHKGCPYGVVTLGKIVEARETAPLLSAVQNVFIWKQTPKTKVCASEQESSSLELLQRAQPKLNNEVVNS